MQAQIHSCDIFYYSSKNYIEGFRNSDRHRRQRTDITLRRCARHLPWIVPNRNFLEIGANILNFNKEFYSRACRLRDDSRILRRRRRRRSRYVSSGTWFSRIRPPAGNALVDRSGTPLFRAARELHCRALSGCYRNFDARGCRSFVTEITYGMKFLRRLELATCALDNAKNKPKRRTPRYVLKGRSRDTRAAAGPVEARNRVEIEKHVSSS